MTVSSDAPSPEVATRPAPSAPSPRSYLPTTTLRAAGRSVRPLAIVGVLVTVVAVTVVLLTGVSHGGRLDPRSADPDGARALAELARQAGHRVELTGTVPSPGEPLSVVVTPASELGRGRAEQLRAGLAGGWEVLLVEPPPQLLEELQVPTHLTGLVSVAAIEPACDLPEAAAAGIADAGGQLFSALEGTGPTQGCYASVGDPSLLRLPIAHGTVTLLGTGRGFTNARLDHDGNAALGLGLLRDNQQVLWLLPGSDPLAAADRSAAAAGQSSLVSLLPRGVRIATLQVLVAVLAFALWRGRRLGAPVAELLPVVVRGAETVEGRARLYRAARARDRAAEALRAGSRARLAVALGLGQEPPPEALVTRVAARSQQPTGSVGGLLYGAGWRETGRPDAIVSGPASPRSDDQALVVLARSLTALEGEVLRS